MIAPFRGVRYNTRASGDISALISPPFDVISPALREALLARDAHNFVRLELPEAADENRYAAAAETLQAWQREGVLVREQAPALYVIENEFAAAGQTWKRRGVFAAVRLPEEGENYVLPHEDTFSEPKADRFRLMEATRHMISPVMSLCEDARGEMVRLLTGIPRAPEAEALDQEAVTHRLWVVRHGALLSALCRIIGSGPLYIADGHHRFDTAVAYRDEMRRLHPGAPGNASFNYALMLILSARDPALKVFPPHRVVSGLGPEGVAWVEAGLRNSFDVSPRMSPCEGIEEELAAAYAEGRHVYGLYRAEGGLAIIAPREQALPASGSPVARLDVTVLHRLLLEPMLQACPNARISYVVDAQEAAGRVQRGEGEFAFFLRGTNVAQVMAVARAGERMPKKATYFFPKAAAGLVISAASEKPL